MKTSAIVMIPGSDLIQMGIPMTQTLAETLLDIKLKMMIKTSKPWATYLLG